MQAKRSGDGLYVDYTPSSAVAVGDVIVIGNLLGIAERPIAANELGALAVEGLFNLVKDNSDISDGDNLYWDADGDPVGGTAGSGAVTTTSTGNKYLGIAIGAAGAAATTALVLKPMQPLVTVSNELANTIADPGDGEAIPVTASGSVPLVSAGAETRTLAAPSFDGQQMSLGFKTDGGDVVVTASAGINQTGNTIMTFADAGDVIVLVAIELGGSLVWRVLANDGVALSS